MTRTVVEAARTGKIGDGKIFVFDVVEAIRIRNDDRGEAVLGARPRAGWHNLCNPPDHTPTPATC